MSKVKLANKTILITGANRGIGLALVNECVKRGAGKVIATARDKQSLTEVVAKYPEVVIAEELDVTKQKDIDNLFKSHPSVDVLINNAGILILNRFKDKNVVETMEKHLETNVLGVARMIETYFMSFRTRGTGAIVNVASIAGLASVAGYNSYSVSKAAVHSLTQATRGELSKTDVLVSGVYPGPIDTVLMKGYKGKMSTPESVAEKICSGIESGKETIFPDRMSKQTSIVYRLFPFGFAKLVHRFS